MKYLILILVLLAGQAGAAEISGAVPGIVYEGAWGAGAYS